MPADQTVPAQAINANLRAIWQQSLQPVSSARKELACLPHSTGPDRKPPNTSQFPQQPAALHLATGNMLYALQRCPEPECWASCCCSITGAVQTSLNSTETQGQAGLCISWTRHCFCSLEGCSGSHWQSRETDRSLGRRMVLLLCFGHLKQQWT